MKKRLASILVLALFSLSLFGCQVTDKDAEKSEQKKEEPVVATAVWEEFLSSGGYKEYTAAYMEQHGEQELEYAIADLNNDKVEELLLQTTEGLPFTNTWVFMLDGEEITLSLDKYGYGSFRYSPTQNAVVATPDWRPFNGTGYTPFYRFDGTQLVFAFEVGEDEGKPFYSEADSDGLVYITADERQTYLKGIVGFEWTAVAGDEK